MRQQITLKQNIETKKAYNSMLNLVCLDSVDHADTLGLYTFTAPAYFIGGEPIIGRLRC